MDFWLLGSAVLLLILSGALFASGSILMTHPVIAMASAGLSVWVPTLIFWQQGEVFLLLGGMAMLLAMLAAYLIHKETVLSMRVVVGHMVNRGLPLYFSAFALIAAGAYGIAHTERTSSFFLVPSPVWDTAFETVLQSSAVRAFLGLPAGFADMRVGSFVEGLLQQELESQGIALESLSPEAHRELSRLETLAGPLLGYVSLIAGVLLFFSLRAALFPVQMCSLFLTLVFIKGMIGLGFVTKMNHLVSQERFVLK
ncbi:MAG: hypothetical protein G01um101466_442 [Parcubacteria group bacterium Gr01-1014_66]|nr:MAG: hypothetical protein G01um101466_442 [Parcubacteria group bacterium Gr01-1014_66]